MLIETIADHQFAQAVETLARDVNEKDHRKQYTTRLINGIDDLKTTVDKIIDKDGHIDQVIAAGTDVFMILYTAENNLYY